MFRFDMLRESDLAGLLRLTGEVSELPPNKVVRRTHVIRQLLTMIGGRSAVVMEMAAPGEGPFARAGTIINIDTSCEAEARYSELFLVHNQPADPVLPGFLKTRGQVVTMVRTVPDSEYYRSEHFNIVRRPYRIDHSLYCRLPTPDGNDMSVGIQRSPGDRAFSDRDKAIVQMLHMHAPHIYCAPAPVRLELRELAPRLQPVLRYLMQGNAEKEIAVKLNLSRHTVHRYTQTIYKELGLHSRGELLAKYARWA